MRKGHERSCLQSAQPAPTKQPSRRGSAVASCSGATGRSASPCAPALRAARFQTPDTIDALRGWDLRPSKIRTRIQPVLKLAPRFQRRSRSNRLGLRHPSAQHPAPQRPHPGRDHPGRQQAHGHGHGLRHDVGAAEDGQHRREQHRVQRLHAVAGRDRRQDQQALGDQQRAEHPCPRRGGQRGIGAGLMQGRGRGLHRGIAGSIRSRETGGATAGAQCAAAAEGAPAPKPRSSSAWRMAWRGGVCASAPTRAARRVPSSACGTRHR